MYNVPVPTGSPWRLRLNACLAGLATSLAAWISQGTLALTDAGGGTDRVAFLPLSPIPLTVALAVGGLVGVAVCRRAPLAPLLLLGFLLLPWLPVEIPPAFLIWTGPMTILVWVGIGAAALFSRWRPSWGDVKRPALSAGLIAMTIFSVAAWRVAPSVPGGDEPHYLIITQSILYDGDLRIENNHLRDDYRSYHRGDLSPHYIRRGRDGEIYSIHAPGVAALVAPAFAVGGYRGVVLFLIGLSALGSALAWHVAWLRTGSYPAAWFGWAAVTLPATTIFHTFTVYPDGLAAIVVLTGAWAVLRADRERASGNRLVMPWLLHGAALAVLPWLHTRLALLAAALGAIVLLRLRSTPNRVKKILVFLLMPAVSGLCWLSYFLAIYGIPDPRAPYGGGVSNPSYIADGLAGLMFDQRFGLLMYAPVLVCAFAGLAAMLVQARQGLTRLPGGRRLAIELLLVIVPYLLVVTSYRMWWAGWSAPARFAMPVLLLLAIPAAEAWVIMRNAGTRATALGALVFTAFASGVLLFVDGGWLAYNVRTGNSLWIEWLTRNPDLVGALPRWAIPSADLFRNIAIWSGTMLLAWIALRWTARSTTLRGDAWVPTLAAAVYGVATMTAATTVWSVQNTDGIAPIPAQLDVLRHLSASSRLLAFQLQPPRLVRAETTPLLLRLRLDLQLEADDEGSSTTIAALPALPAGEYRVTPNIRGAGGRLLLGIANNESVWQMSLTSPATPLLIRLPVDVRAIIVRTDEQRQPGKVVVEPQTILPPKDRLIADYAKRATRYAGFTVFFLDNRSYPEPDAFWVGGERQTTIVLQPDVNAATARLILRNAPVPNHVRIQSGHWHDDLEMAPGARHLVHVPLDTRHGATVVTVSSASGFVPSTLDPGSLDHRSLGVLVRILEPGGTM